TFAGLLPLSLPVRRSLPGAYLLAVPLAVLRHAQRERATRSAIRLAAHAEEQLAAPRISADAQPRAEHLEERDDGRAEPLVVGAASRQADRPVVVPEDQRDATRHVPV